MKRHRHTPEQIVRKLREGERLLNEGKDLTEVLRTLEISEATWNRWRAQYGGMKADEAKRLQGAGGRERPAEEAGGRGGAGQVDCSRSWLRETSDPGASPAGGGRLQSIVSGSPNGGRAGWSVSTARRNGSRRGPAPDEEDELRRRLRRDRPGASAVGVEDGARGLLRREGWTP